MDTEKFPIQKEIFGEQDVKEFIQSRKINPEDFYILEELALIPKQLIIADFHNFFSLNRERSQQELERTLTFLETVKDDSLLEQRVMLNRLLLDFVRKYNWAIAWNLVAVFERRK